MVVNRQGEMQDADFARFFKRVAIFMRKGWAEEKAENFAYDLVQRDFERDDRRACIECAYLLTNGQCYEAKQGRIHDASTTLTPVQDVLQRCPNFKWATK